MMADLGLGLCSFSLGTPIEELAGHLAAYKDRIAGCTSPLGATVNDPTIVFAMANCAPTRAESFEVAKPNFEWHVERSTEIIGELPRWLEELESPDATYDYLERSRRAMDAGRHKQVTFEALLDMGAVIAGDPDDVGRQCQAFADAGADVLLMLLNPCIARISHAEHRPTVPPRPARVRVRSPG